MTDNFERAMRYPARDQMITDFAEALESGCPLTLMSLNRNGVVYTVEGRLVASENHPLAIAVNDSDTVLNISDERLLDLRLGFGHGDEMIASWERNSVNMTSAT